MLREQESFWILICSAFLLQWLHSILDSFALNIVYMSYHARILNSYNFSFIFQKNIRVPFENCRSCKWEGILSKYIWDWTIKFLLSIPINLSYQVFTYSKFFGEAISANNWMSSASVLSNRLEILPSFFQEKLPF